MTVICREMGLLFLQTPHAASTAIGKVLREQYGCERLQNDQMRAGRLPGLRRKHHSLDDLFRLGLLTPEERARLFVVASVRNPFDTVYTEFARADQGGRFVRATRRIRRLLGRRRDRRADFERFVERRYAPGRLLRLAGRRGRVATDWAAGADHVIRFERLQEDFDRAMRHVGREPVTIPAANVTEGRKGRDYREVYTPRARRLVEQAFRDQLERYRYAFEGAIATADGDASGGP